VLVAGDGPAVVIEVVVGDPLPAVINAADPVAAWDGLELADQRLFIDRLCTVTILPAGRKGRGLDPITLDSAPKYGLGRGSLPTAV
jgi:site-specific DNA recombinase